MAPGSRPGLLKFKVMKAIRINKVGGPEVLLHENLELRQPGPGEALVKIEVAGVNYIDTYHRTGLYPAPLPFTPGVEGAGTVMAVGPDVASPRVGERVAYAMNLGAYAEEAVVPAWKLVPIPAEVDFEVAAAAMVQGLTAHYLSRSTFPLKPGDIALVHAAAGGVGLLLVQMAKLAGAVVFGTVSTPEKAKLAKEAGADEVILYTEKDFEHEVRRATQGVDVVYDSVGATTFAKSLRCLKPRGMLVLFGQSSGPVGPIDPQILAGGGSLFLTRPSLAHYAASREELVERAGEVFGWLANRQLKVRIDRRFPLREASEAHRALESRQTTGKLVLVNG